MLLRKLMFSEADFFCLQFEVDSYFTKTFYRRASVFVSTLGILLVSELQVTLMDGKRLLLVKKGCLLLLILVQIITLS